MHDGDRRHFSRSVLPSTTVSRVSTGSSVGTAPAPPFTGATNMALAVRTSACTGFPGQPVSRLHTPTGRLPANARPAGGTYDSEPFQRLFCTLAASEIAVLRPGGIETVLFHVLLMFRT